jgi:hypothetical protein
MSSIDDEDDENSSEFRNPDVRSAPRCLPNVRKKFMSTPNDNNNAGIRVRPHNNISVIEEEPNSIHSLLEEDQQQPSDQVSSVEKGREADQLNESYHVRLLLDQNKKLCSERTKLQQLCDSVTGDFEGISYKCHRLEEVLSEKEQLVDQLMGKLAALQISLTTAKEAQSETNNKLVIAENTISSLRNELKEMHQADGMDRIRVLYESQLKQSKEKYESERADWMHDRDALNEVIDEQKHQISKLKIELDLRLKKAAADRRSAHSDTTTKKLESEIETLRQTNRQLESINSQHQNSMTDLRDQISRMQSSMIEKEKEVSHLRQEIQLKDHQIQAHKTEVSRLNDEKKSLTESLKQLENRLSESRVHDEMRDKSLKSKMDQQVIAQVKEYRDKIMEKYSNDFASRLQELQKSQQRQKEQLDECVTRICSWIEGVTGQGLKPHECELYTVFDPVIKIWFAIEKKMDEQLSKMAQKRNEIEDAKRELEEAYMDSKSDSHENDSPLLENLHQELSEARDEITALKEKVSKYKKNYTAYVKKYAAEKDQLKQDYAALIQRQVSVVCRDREEQLMSLLSRDSRQLLQQINQAYSESLRSLKEQNDLFFEQSNSKSLKKMGEAIISYHEIVTKKITQRNSQLTRQINQTLCEVDGGDGSFVREADHLSR